MFHCMLLRQTLAALDIRFTSRIYSPYQNVSIQSVLEFFLSATDQGQKTFLEPYDKR